MPHALEEMEAKLRDILQNGDGLVLSADIWTSRRGHSFLGIVASFIDATFRGHTAVSTYKDTTPQIVFIKSMKVY